MQKNEREQGGDDIDDIEVRSRHLIPMFFGTPCILYILVTVLKYF